MPATNETAFTERDYADSYAIGMELHWWTRARASVVRHAIDGLPRTTILDVGCGPGLTVKHLRALGHDCIGCEVGRPTVREDVRDAVHVATDALDLDPATRARTGLILLLDVLEHIEDPAAFLSRISGAFPNLQGIIVTVPARHELWSAWDDRYGHFRRYDLPAIRALLSGAGFRVGSARYFFHMLYPVMWLAVRLLGRKTVETPPPPDSLFHRLLGKAFAAEARFLPGWIAGTSIIAVANPIRAQDGQTG